MQGHGSAKDLSSEGGGLATRLSSDLSCNRSPCDQPKGGVRIKIPDYRELQASDALASQLVPAAFQPATHEIKTVWGTACIFGFTIRNEGEQGICQ